MSRNYDFLALSCVIILVALPFAVQADGYLQIQFIRYDNPDGRVKDGTLCDPFGVIDIGDKCDPVFRLRADAYLTGGDSLFEYQQTSVYDNAESIIFGHKFGDVSNPVSVAMNFTNPGQVFLTIDTVDKDFFPPDDPMDTFEVGLSIIADNNKRDIVLASQAVYGSYHLLRLTYWFTCNANFYGRDCNTYCAAQNDNAKGHYTCDSSGRKVCTAGWTGDACTTPDPRHRLRKRRSRT